MGSGNWIVDNLNSALEMWNGRLEEIWQLITTSPENFKGGGIWNVIVGINGGLKAVGYALLVLFFVMGIVKTCGSFTEMKKPELAFKCFIRFVLAQAAVTWGMELMTGVFRVAQGMVTTIIDSSGLKKYDVVTLDAANKQALVSDTRVSGRYSEGGPDRQLSAGGQGIRQFVPDFRQRRGLLQGYEAQGLHHAPVRRRRKRRGSVPAEHGLG